MTRLLSALDAIAARWLFCRREPVLREAFGEPEWKPSFGHWVGLLPLPGRAA
jgi:hypothetical protein